jgi:hypothetical protein
MNQKLVAFFCFAAISEALYYNTAFSAVSLNLKFIFKPLVLSDLL